jgi:signal transduction histidine kinase/FixJ family two-component response regulator/putative methionine-R-sulfoxide reductase with GAF domain
MSDKTQRIVIIDDEKRMCDSLSALLSQSGYEVRTFQNPLEALDRINSEEVDLVVTDIKMPRMSGLDILQKVHEKDELLPVILMTAYATLSSAVEAVSKGAYDYLLKPIEFTQFELAIKRALDKRNSDRFRHRIVDDLKQSNEKLKRHVAELNALYEAGTSIGSAGNPKELLRKIVELAAKVTEAKVGSVMLLDDAGEYLTIEAAIGLTDEIIATTKLPLGSSIAGLVAQQGVPMIIDDVENDERFQRMNKERYGAASLLSVPLRIQNKVLGVVNMANKKDGGIFSADDLRLLSTFAGQVAVTVDDANQFEKNRRRLTEFEILHELNSELPKVETMNQFRRLLVDKLNRVVRIDCSIWFSYDSEADHLIPGAASGIEDIPVTESGCIDLNKVNPDSLKIDAPELADFDYSNINKLTEYLIDKIKSGNRIPCPKSVNMAIPITKSGELAEIVIFGSDNDRPYDGDDESLARLVISQAALMFEREKSLLNATRLVTMGNMISEISHDLRRPLTSLKGTLQIVRQKWPDAFEDTEYFKSAEEEIHRMNELVRELVDFSNPNKYQTQKVDLRSIIERASELTGPDLRKNNISFKKDFAKANWELILNKNQILEALLNLFLNAIEGMPEGGELSVTGLIERPDHKKTDYLAVKISDTGVGIKKEILSRIFERYYTTKETGTGLGLAVVERIISAHNGTLKVESTEGQGTTFTLYFPLSG